MKPTVVGKVQMVALTEVKPNTWNPNVMTPFIRASLKRGLQYDGWLASQALLVWATDEKKRKKNLIIDGEHRWLVANELGLKVGPMVFLQGITEAQAKALTVKLNQKRGEFEDTKLGALIRDLGEVSAIDLGIEESNLMRLLDEGNAAVPVPAPHYEPKSKSIAPAANDMPTSDERRVPLYFDEKQHQLFLNHTKDLSTSLGTNTTSDTVLEVLRRAVVAAYPSR